MKKLITLTTLALLSSSSYVLANAGPAPMPAPAPEPAPVVKLNPFSGLLLGGQLGLNSNATTVKERTVRPLRRSASSNVGGTGFQGGLGIGYGWLFNRFYAGLETNYNFSSLKGKSEAIGLGGNHLRDAKLSAVWDISARLGMAMGANNNVLVYIKPGIAFGKWKSKATHPNIGVGSKSKNATGFLIGTGMDYAMSDRMSMGIEYTYAKFDSFSYFQGNPTTCVANRKVTVDPAVHAFMAHLKFRVF